MPSSSHPHISIRQFLKNYPDTGAVIHNRAELLLVTLTLGVPCVGIFGVVDYEFGHVRLGALQLAITLILLPCLFLLRAGSKRLGLYSSILLAASLVLFLALLADGGIENSGIYWVSIFPFLAFTLGGCKSGMYWILAFFAGLLAVLFASQAGLLIMPYSITQITYFFASFLIFSAFAFLFSFIRERDSHILQTSHNELVESQQQLKKAQADLESLVAERTDKLRKANQKLKTEIENRNHAYRELRETQQKFIQAQKMEAIGTLVGGIAHDFNNMLSGITANLYMVRNRTKDEDTKKRLNKVDALVMHAADMIRQMLTFARKDELQLSRVELISFIKQAYKLARVSIPAHIRTEIDYPAGSLYIQGDATQLQQILMNLMNNARDALGRREDARITVKVSEFRPDEAFRQRLPGREAESYACLSVCDNGEGIPQAMLSKVFEPFFTTKETGKGTGLGLAMVYGAVQSHGGLVDVQSRIGQGTCFNLYFPLNELAESEATTSLYDVAPGQGECILLVDDDAYLREANRDLLAHLNYRVIEAADGQEAIGAYRRHANAIALVLMDLSMPGMDGIRAAEQIRKISEDAKIVFITGYDKDNTLGRMKVSEWGDLLYKPLTVEKLSWVIRKHLPPAT